MMSALTDFEGALSIIDKMCGGIESLLNLQYKQRKVNTKDRKAYMTQRDIRLSQHRNLRTGNHGANTIGASLFLSHFLFKTKALL